MADQTAVPAYRMNAEFVAIVAIGVTVMIAMFSQFTWLDGKFERMEAKFDVRFEQLDRKIDNLGTELRTEIGILRAGQASLDKRLAVVESHVLGAPLDAPADSPPDPAS